MARSGKGKNFEVDFVCGTFPPNGKALFAAEDMALSGSPSDAALPPAPILAYHTVRIHDPKAAKLPTANGEDVTVSAPLQPRQIEAIV